jgi:hypothetical protein
MTTLGEILLAGGFGALAILAGCSSNPGFGPSDAGGAPSAPAAKRDSGVNGKDAGHSDGGHSDAGKHDSGLSLFGDDSGSGDGGEDAQTADAPSGDDGEAVDTSEAGMPDAADDGGACTMVPPETPSTCDANCSVHNCNPNGCYGTYWCEPVTSKCYPQPATCP